MRVYHYIALYLPREGPAARFPRTIEAESELAFLRQLADWTYLGVNSPVGKWIYFPQTPPR